MFRNIITLLMFCCLSLHLNAQEVLLKDNHPQRHVVVKGDTLWGIAGKFLKDPWLWPKVWKFNRTEIKNPHLIYPGDVVVLDLSSGKPELKLLRETVTLQPGVIEEPLDKSAISTIPLNVIAPFLSQPLVIEKDQLDDSPRIVGAQDNRVILSAGSKIYLNKVDEDQGLNWFVYRPGVNLVDPDTKKLLGIEAIYLGNAKVSKFGEPASAIVTKAGEEIFVKDKLVASGDEGITNFVPHAPETDVSGRIIKIYGGLAEAGPQSIITISKGSIDGLEIGHVLAINRFGKIIKDPEYDQKKSKISEDKAKLNSEASKDTENFENKPEKNEGMKLEPGMIKLPDERIGLAMIFRVFDNVSYALVMQASEPVHILDSVKTP
ncbi:MAG TPA: LysM peptidoglycan-binding domain-containing protein [Methylotenera sp.]|jgi:hypothetical protein|nr:MAG: peptidoglycan-binding protein LysM [Mehylophilales bacterium 35-46-6]HQS37940.1 LysM peptidoglycan-binding domain-containing protein [Methylotenera sp.]HQS44146.1 LysM peptidoglycan-binding domain-containing protein [Methylotenera sp.]